MSQSEEPLSEKDREDFPHLHDRSWDGYHSV